MKIIIFLSFFNLNFFSVNQSIDETYCLSSKYSQSVEAYFNSFDVNDFNENIKFCAKNGHAVSIWLLSVYQMTHLLIFHNDLSPVDRKGLEIDFLKNVDSLVLKNYSQVLIIINSIKRDLDVKQEEKKEHLFKNDHNILFCIKGIDLPENFHSVNEVQFKIIKSKYIQCKSKNKRTAIISKQK